MVLIDRTIKELGYNEMINQGIRDISGTTRYSDSGKLARVWTNDSVNLNKQTQDSFVKSQIEKSEVPVKTQIAGKNEDSSETTILSAADFIERDNIVVTDTNSTLLKDLGERQTDNDGSGNVPKTLMLDENGILSEPGGVGEKIPTDIISTGKFKTATIGTFNIEWLGGCPYKKKRGHVPKRREEDYDKIAGVIKESGASMLGLQEVVTEEALLRVLKYLPDWGFILSKNKNQKVAVIFDKKRVKYDAGSVECLNEMADPETFNYGNLRPPLSVFMKVDNFDFNLVVVHQKSGFRNDSLKIRNKQSKMLNSWMKNYLRANSDKDMIVLGDFNDMLDSRSLDAIGEGGIIRYATSDLGKGEYSNIPYKSVIDHIAYTTVKGGADEEVKKGSVRTINEKRHPGYTKNISDHKPVLIEVNTEKDND